MSTPKVRGIVAREVLDSRGFPTVEVELTLGDAVGRAIVPSGASTGEAEALELRDGDKKRYQGKGVLKAVGNVRDKIAPALLGREFALQSLVDDALRDLDGTPNKSKLGANSILGVSMAFARAQALASDAPLFKHLAGIFTAGGASHPGAGSLLPVPMMNILNGGKHADNGLAVQEFMIVPAGFDRFSEALRAGAEVFHRLKKILHDKGLSTGVGDEGGFAPHFSGEKPHEQALAAILQAIDDAGYKAGRDIFLAIDAAASEFVATDFAAGKDKSAQGGEVQYLFEGKKIGSREMTQLYEKWADTYPIISIEDGLAEHDWAGWVFHTEKLGTRLQLVGDDIFVTNPIFLKKGIESDVANAVLIKLNQIGTVTETLETMKLAAQAGYASIVSHRSGETEDTFIADLAVGTGSAQIKTGSASRTDRIAKYNQLLRIEELLGSRAKFLGVEAFNRDSGKRGHKA